MKEKKEKPLDSLAYSVPNDAAQQSVPADRTNVLVPVKKHKALHTVLGTEHGDVPANWEQNINGGTSRTDTLERINKLRKNIEDPLLNSFERGILRNEIARLEGQTAQTHIAGNRTRYDNIPDDKLNAFERAARERPKKSFPPNMSPSERMKAARTTGEEEQRSRWGR